MSLNKWTPLKLMIPFLNLKATGATLLRVIGVSLLIPHSLICMIPVQTYSKITAAHYSAPCQGEGCMS